MNYNTDSNHIHRCECIEDCDVPISPDIYQKLNTWRTEYENDTGDALKDGHCRLLAGYDYLIVVAAHVHGLAVLHRYGDACVILSDEVLSGNGVPLSQKDHLAEHHQ